MDRYLIIVSRDRPELVQQLTSTYGHLGEAEILLDRRQASRLAFPHKDADRRSATCPGTGVEGQGFLVIPRAELLRQSF